jgi:hypothetical protein
MQPTPLFWPEAAFGIAFKFLATSAPSLDKTVPIKFVQLAWPVQYGLRQISARSEGFKLIYGQGVEQAIDYEPI